MEKQLVTEKLMGIFLLGRGITNDSHGDNIEPHTWYRLEIELITNKYIITKSLILNESKTN